MRDMDFKKIRENFPKQEEIFGWIEGLCRFPHRRTGSPESRAAQEYLKEQFEKIGLQEITVERVPSVNFDAKDWSLQVEGKELPCFMINGTLHPKPKGEFEAGLRCRDTEIVYLGEGRSEDFEGMDVRDKLVLCDCPWFESDEDTYADKWCATEGIVYDPDRDIRVKLRKTDSYSPNAWPYNYFEAQKRGAAGFVGILNDYFSDGINWNEDYSELAASQGCRAMEIPGLWIGTDTWELLKGLLRDGKAKASMGMKTMYLDGSATNVWGVLPGVSTEAVLVHSHYDAVFTGAVQDASGMSEVLALARYFAGFSKEQRPKTMIFAGLDGHYTDYAGHQAFIKKRLSEGRKILCDFVIEHIGKEVGLGEKNEPIVSDEPEIRLVYVTDTKGMVDIVCQAVRENDMRRTIVLPVPLQNAVNQRAQDAYEFAQDEVISDAYYSSINGISVVSMLSPQMYLFHPMDRPDMVPKTQLMPVGVTFAGVIQEFMAM